MDNPRLTRIITSMVAESFDYLILNPGATLTYLTGLQFHLMERPVLLMVGKNGETAMVLPELEVGKLSTALIQVTPFTYQDNPSTWLSAFKNASEFMDLNNKTVGIEPNHLRVLELRFLEQSTGGIKFVSAESMLSLIRMIKSETEISAMRSAVKIAQEALIATLPCIKTGLSERFIASELTIQLFRAGSDPELPFYPIVASGPNSANPHSVPTDRLIQPGDTLIIDWGASFNHYFSDLTRTFAIGDISPELVNIYETVRSANEAGKSTARFDTPAGAIDKAARKVIESAGYGKYFTHRTGHGLGMETHEEPYIYLENQTLLKPGMTFTVEPGIYLPGTGGVRIEDDILITDSGCDCLSDYPRHLQILG
jgi:Xaa-Pro dipeptidase